MSARRHQDAEISAGGDIKVADVATGLADEFQLRQLFKHLARDGQALLREQQGIAAFHLLDHARRVGISIVVDFYLMALQFRVGLCFAQGVGVVVDDGDFHREAPFGLSFKNI